jgi:hypothetical protein
MSLKHRLSKLEKLAGPADDPPIVAVYFDAEGSTPIWFHRECRELEDWPAGLGMQDIPRAASVYRGIDPHVVCGHRTEIDPRVRPECSGIRLGE